MTTNQTLHPTKEQVLEILKSSYCLINNWGGSRFHYMPEPNQESEEYCILFENDSGKSYKFYFEGAKIRIEGKYLQLTNVEDSLPHMFIVLARINLEQFL